MKEYILNHLAGLENGYGVCGIIDRRGRIYPLSSDTKVLSTIFENIARRAVGSYAIRQGIRMFEPDKQNYYPDFTLATGTDDPNKIAIDVKTTYKVAADDKFAFTLGSYTSFMRNGTKNILFPFNDYAAHWIIGFVYRRVDVDPAAATYIYTPAIRDTIPVPFTDVEVFMQEKWRISGDKAGSGNTTNIGSISGTLRDFQEGNGVFQSAGEFLTYWRGYGRTRAERDARYRRVVDFRVMYQC